MATFNLPHPSREPMHTAPRDGRTIWAVVNGEPTLVRHEICRWQIVCRTDGNRKLPLFLATEPEAWLKVGE